MCKRDRRGVDILERAGPRVRAFLAAMRAVPAFAETALPDEARRKFRRKIRRKILISSSLDFCLLLELSSFCVLRG